MNLKLKFLRPVVAALFVFILLCSYIGALIPLPVEAAPIVSGNAVSISNSNVYIMATPSTLTASGWVEVTFQSLNYEGPVDVVYGFNGLDNVKAINPEVWESYIHNKTRQVPAVLTAEFKPDKIISVNNTALRPAKADTDLSLNSKYAEITYEQTDPIMAKTATQRTIKLAYDSYDSKTGAYSYKYNGQVAEAYTETYVDWNPKAQPTTNTLSYAGASKWNTAPYKSVVKNEVQKTRVWIDIPFGGTNTVSGKYNIGIKPSSLTLQQAKDQGKLWLLDPWYSASWSYRKAITVTNASADYQSKILIGKTSGATGEEVDCNGHCLDTFADLRFTGADGTTLLDYWIESVAASGTSYLATVWVQNNATPDTTLYMYYGNAGATTTSNGANTFIVFDDFERGANGDNIGGSWTQSAGAVKISNEQKYGGSLSAKWPGTPTTGIEAYIPVTASTSIAIRYRYYKEDASNINIYHGDTAHTLSLTILNTSEDVTVYDGSSNIDTTLNCLKDAWGLIELNTFDWVAKTMSIVLDGTTKTGIDISWTYTLADNVVKIQGSILTDKDNWIDNFIVRKWAATEPSFAYGSEAGYPTCALTGTVTAATASDIVAGGKTIILTLTNDTWVASGATFNAQRANIISGMDSAQSEAHGWDADYKANAATYVADVVRDSDTQVTVTMSALAAYAVTADETITATIPAAALTIGTAIVASPTFTITAINGATVTTQAGSAVLATTATGNGTITNLNGGANCSDRGICYSSVNNPPTTADSKVFESGSFGVAAFSEPLTGLSTGTTYYLRAYVIQTAITSYGSTVTILTKPAAPTGIGATDGTDSTKVVVTWTKSTGATNYHVWRDAVDLGAAGDVATKDDSGAGAPTITAGTATASDATSDTVVTLSVAGETGVNGTTHTYKVVASNATGNSADSVTNTGYRGTTTLTYAWQRSGGEPDAAFGAIGGGTTDPYNDTTGVAFPSWRWYYCTISMVGAANVDTNHDKGWLAVAPTVTTGICSGSGTTWAILNGNVTATGSPATITQEGFEYGLTTGYGTTSVNTGTYGVGAYSKTLTGLSSSTIYHYRAKATNGVWGYGADAVFATKGSPAITTYFNTGSDNCTPIYGSDISAQTFTTSATTEYSVTSIRLEMLRVGSPGTVTVSIRHTAGGVPTGVDLTSGTINGNTLSTSAYWYDIPMATEKSLELNTVYAVVVSAANGDISNYVCWRKVNAGGFAGGNGVTSVNGGVAWTAQAWDQMFELWGNQSLEIQDAKVFQSYKATGDWLIAVRYINTFAPYYDTYDIKKYFVIQLIDSTGVVKASNPCTEWGNRVGSVYLSATSVTPLTYGGTYKVRIQGTFTGTPYTEYSLVATDWLGDDLTNLDSWAITSAGIMNTHDTLLKPLTKAYIANIATRGAVLTATGGDLLSIGIPGLSTVRPLIFQIYTVGTTYTPATGTATMANTVRSGTAAAIGPDAVVAFGQFGQNVMGGLAYNQVIALLAVIIAFGLAACTFPFGHTTAANVLCMGVLCAFSYFGFDWIWIGMIYAVSVFLLAKKLWIDTGI